MLRGHWLEAGQPLLELPLPLPGTYIPCPTSAKPLPLSAPLHAKNSEHFRQNHNNGLGAESKPCAKYLHMCLTTFPPHKHPAERSPTSEVRRPRLRGVKGLAPVLTPLELQEGHVWFQSWASSPLSALLCSTLLKGFLVSVPLLASVCRETRNSGNWRGKRMATKPGVAFPLLMGSGNTCLPGGARPPHVLLS